jgi:hypothetical protein
MSSHDNNFYVFHYTRKSVNDCCSAMDAGYPESDAERGDQCVRQCQWCCWGPIFVIDILTLPYRGIKHLVKKCKGSKKSKNSKKSKKN